eukprot:jgi/Chrpa1/15945/Chrysochromulina_OHIO_Genome00001585-RA
MPILSVNTELDFSLPYRVLAFYAIAPVAAPDDAVAEHRQYLLKHDMVGRVYICADGLNAQVSGTTASCEAYRAFAAAAFPGIQLFFKEDPVAEPAFPKLRVKHKALVPGVAVDLNARGEDVEPERWAAMIAQGDGIGAPQPTILDVRNGYEWDVGHFEGAERPTLDEFAEFDAAAYGLPTDPEAKKSTPVMMYCTGGIRCEYFSAKLKAEGFEKVYKLQGGVQHYGNTMAARGGAARCNIDCNRLHLVCPRCLAERRGFCCESCNDAPRRRPLDLLAATDENGQFDFKAAIAATQGPLPGQADPNKLVNVKPANVPRKLWDADVHGTR